MTNNDMSSVIYAECRVLILFAECPNAESCYAECRGAVNTALLENTKKLAEGKHSSLFCLSSSHKQEILKGEVSLYH
jgi:hypothetical protein